MDNLRVGKVTIDAGLGLGRVWVHAEGNEPSVMLFEGRESEARHLYSRIVDTLNNIQDNRETVYQASEQEVADVNAGKARWTTCACGHIAQEHNGDHTCGWPPGCQCKRYTGKVIYYKA